MSDYQYIPMIQHTHGRNSLFRVEVALDNDGRWHAWIACLPGCAVWGHSREDALEAVRHTAHAYLEALLAKGLRVSPDVETIDGPAVTVTV